jgi:hypothetical protein
MKTKQKVSITLAAILALFLLSSFLPQQTETKYLTVKTIEFYNAIYDSKITIVDENGKVEEFDLDKLRSKNLADNAKKVNDVFNNLSKKGYALINSTTASWGADGFISTYIFEKK